MPSALEAQHKPLVNPIIDNHSRSYSTADKDPTLCFRNWNRKGFSSRDLFTFEVSIGLSASIVGVVNQNEGIGKKGFLFSTSLTSWGNQRISVLQASKIATTIHLEREVRCQSLSSIMWTTEMALVEEIIQNAKTLTQWNRSITPSHTLRWIIMPARFHYAFKNHYNHMKKKAHFLFAVFHLTSGLFPRQWYLGQKTILRLSTANAAMRNVQRNKVITNADVISNRTPITSMSISF